MLILVHVLNWLDQALEFIIIEQLSNISLYGIKYTIPIFFLNLLWVRNIRPNDLDDFIFFIESFVYDEFLHVQVFFADVFSIDMIKLEHDVDQSSINQSCLFDEVLMFWSTSTDDLSYQNFESNDRDAHSHGLMSDIELEAVLYQFLSFELSRRHLILRLVIILVTWFF